MEAVSELARLAKWRPPRLVSVIVLAGHDLYGGREPAVPREVLKDLHHAPPVPIVPDPYGPGRRQMNDVALRGVRAALGPPVGLRETAKSLNWAREALCLAEQGIFDANSVIHCDDHLTDLVLRRGGDLLDRLRAKRLAPLRGMAQGRQDMLADTLLAWLETGKTSSVASPLFIHPHTAPYPLPNLHHPFRAQLDSPDARFELALVLRAQHAGPRRPAPSDSS